MNAVSLDLLRTFVVCATVGTFTAAARSLRISTSAVSQQVRTLEGQLGAPLFERRGRRVALTDAGQRLAGAVQAELGRIDLALEEVVSAHTVVRGRVAIGAPRPFARHWLRPRLPALLAAHPELELELEFDVPSALEGRLADGALDLAILVRRPALPGLEAHRLGIETFVAVGAPGRVPADLRAARWIVFDRDLPMHAHFWRSTFGARSPLPDRIAARVGSLDEMQALAEAGVGMVVLPDYAVADAVAAGRLVVASSPGRPARNVIWLAHRSGAPRTARFVAVLDALR